MNVYLLCSAILVIAYFLLANNVSRLRAGSKIGFGMADDPSGPLNRAIRAHGNSAEYTPVFLVLFLYFLSVGASGWITWVVAGVTFCRVLHPISILMAPDLNAIYPPRFVAAVGTYLGGIALGVALLIRALNG
jgi:uncharacterized membrane protein YecN with MAPEG domain